MSKIIITDDENSFKIISPARAAILTAILFILYVSVICAGAWAVCQVVRMI